MPLPPFTCEATAGVVGIYVYGSSLESEACVSLLDYFWPEFVVPGAGVAVNITVNHTQCRAVRSRSRYKSCPIREDLASLELEARRVGRARSEASAGHFAHVRLDSCAPARHDTIGRIFASHTSEERDVPPADPQGRTGARKRRSAGKGAVVKTPGPAFCSCRSASRASEKKGQVRKVGPGEAVWNGEIEEGKRRKNRGTGQDETDSQGIISLADKAEALDVPRSTKHACAKDADWSLGAHRELPPNDERRL
jgi:hypothetical protein